ncbi:hypothetical protein [Nocardioides sp.]|uniref:hypothetical protein n=1 Tax=Nocardioides sp. TaxID=35761 RepID=UPI002ED9D3E1
MTPEGTQASSFDLLDQWLAHGERDAGRAVIEDLTRAALPVLTDPSRQPDPAVTPPSPEGGGASDARGSTGAAPTAPVTSRPATPQTVDLSIEPRSRHVAGFVLFAATVLTTLQAAVAYADPGILTLGLALALAGGTVAAWRAWVRRPVTAVLATGSRLEIRRAGGRHVFDLADLRSPVDVIGVAGERTWRVLFYRRGMAPYVLDATMVDPAAFLRVLHAQRPEVHYVPR